MIKIVIALLVVFSFTKPNHIDSKIKFMMEKEFGMTISNGTIIIINNGTCNGLCGSKLNKFLIKEIPLHTKDSLFFLITNNEISLIDTLDLFSNKRIIKSNFSTLNKYGIYDSYHYAIRIKNKKTFKSDIINKKSSFKYWAI
jgi:hypothetical protein